MNIYNYIKQNGLRNVLDVIYHYKIDVCIQKVLYKFLKNKKLKNIIMIESHNDFDTNGGAFYNYLIKNGYNNKYKIVWLLKNYKLCPLELPENVECVPENKPSIKKDYYMCVGKIFTYDQNCRKKMKEAMLNYLWIISDNQEKRKSSTKSFKSKGEHKHEKTTIAYSCSAYDFKPRSLCCQDGGSACAE